MNAEACPPWALVRYAAEGAELWHARLVLAPSGRDGCFIVATPGDDVYE